MGLYGGSPCTMHAYSRLFTTKSLRGSTYGFDKSMIVWLQSPCVAWELSASWASETG
ncbi:MAG: hypothetical protein JWP97_6405 [Labilithrix sp.]|nr:hypothetical protein [Labilithrix sp.]